ncbi:hypothetical protein DL93DRAFT_2173623 [Clavulina sp. PMI_390]|nr:hypothetical protein DL93DRAFT_2173623 [Clavulina sp. PMI_390]
MKSFTTLFAATTLLANTAMAADITGLLNTLHGLNLTSLVGAATTVANTTGGARLLSLLENNSSAITLFAPSNAAFAGVNPYFANDPVWLQQALAYHVVPESVDVDSIPTSPDNAIYPTALNDPSVVKHFGEIPQYLGLVKAGNKTLITNQNNWPCIVLKTTSYQNVLIHVISTVIDLPPAMLDALTLPSYPWTANLTTLVALSGTSSDSAIATSKDITIFAPNNQAITDAISHGRISSSPNATTVAALISNHIVNGTILFTGKDQADYTSAGGETITFGKGGAFGYVVYYKGELVANVIQGDIITQNGVLHIIDAVLPEFETNGAAASSAWSSELAAATSTAPPAKRTLGNSRFFRRL